MSPKLTPVDLADYLKSEEMQIEFLNDAIESDDAAYLAHALGIVARARNMTQIAKEAEMARSGLYKALSKDGNPRLTTLLSVTQSLGLRLRFQGA